MPFKDKLIKSMQRCITQFSENTSGQSGSLMEQNDQQNKNKCIKSRTPNKRYSKVFTPKIKNIYELFLNKRSQTKVHVVNFYNMIAINQQALLSQDYEQSYCRTAFYLKSIKKAEFKSNCLIFHLTLSNYSFTPIQYSIQRFKSFGDKKFYSLACKMEETIARFNELKKHAGKEMKLENNDKFDKYIESLGNKMFVVRTSSKFILSKSFIELLEYNPEEYCIESVKYRSSLYQGCSTKNYYQVMYQTLQNIKLLIDLLFDRISLQTFLDNSIIRFKDYLYTKNNKKIYAKVKSGMPNPYLTIYEVEQVINISDQLSKKAYFEGEKKQHLNILKEELRNASIKIVRKLIDLPPSYLPDNQHKVAHYVQRCQQNSQQRQQAQ